MADTSNLSSYLKDVADAIREKKGTQEQIPAANFDTEIRNISSGGLDTSDATAVAEDIASGKTAYAKGQKITGNVETIESGFGRSSYAKDNELVKNPSNLSFTKQVTTNLLFRNGSNYGTIITNELIASKGGITPEKIAKGTTIYGIEGNLESGGTIINNQDKTITSNGQYTADEGYTGLGTVNVNVIDPEYEENLSLTKQILGIV